MCSGIGAAGEEAKEREKERQVQQLQLWEASFSAVLEELRPVQGPNALVCVHYVSTLSHIRTRTHKQRLGMCPLCVHTLTHTHMHARSTPWDVSALHTHTYAHARTITSTPLK